MSVLKTELLEQYIARGSRRNFLAVASKVAGLGAASMAMNAQSTSGPGLSAASDLNVLNFALTLEFLEASFYVQFLGAGTLPAGVTSMTGLTGTVTGNPRAFTVGDLSGATGFQGLPALFSAGIFSLLTQIRDHEVAHVAALIQTIKSLGGTPTQPCTYTFPVTDFNSFLKTAQALENTGVSAYDGAINMISNPTLIQTGASIATVEARHASFLNLIAGGGLTTGNFQPGSTAAGGAAAGGATAGGTTAGGATGGTTTGGTTTGGTTTGGTTSGGTTGGTTTGGTTGGTTTGGTTTGGTTGGTTTGGTATGGTTTGGTTSGGAITGGALAGGTGSAATASPTIPGVSASPFPNAFDTPLSMAQIVQIATPFLGSCPVPLQVASLAVTITPVASSTSPFTVPQVTLDLSNSVSGTSQASKFAFSVPPNVSAFCPATSGGTSISGSTGSTGTTSSGSITGSGSTGTTGSGSTGTTGSGSTGTTGSTTTTTAGSTATTDITGTGTSTPANATCPLKPAILTSPNSPKAIIQFVAGSGFYPVQVSVTDATGRVATQIIVLAYQAAGGLSLPAGTPGMTMAMPSGSSGSATGGTSTGTGSTGTGTGGTGAGTGSTGSGTGSTGTGSTGTGSTGTGSGTGTGTGTGSGSGS